MQLSNEDAIKLAREGFEALQQGRPAQARQCFERITATGQANVQIWLLLATACNAQNDLEGEEAALDRLLALEPRFVRGQILKADCRTKAGDERSALHFYESALLNAAEQEVPDALVPDLRRAEAVVAQWRARIDGEREARLIANGLPPAERSARFQQSIDILAGRKQIYLQQPSAYFFPGLPQTQFFERADFDWAPRIESATDAIREELNGLLADGRDGFKPYLHHDPNRPRMGDRQLLDSPDWSALFLCENGLRDEAAIARCPHTWEAVQAAPGVTMANSPTIMFSLLRPGARIAPHVGMFNTRLVCHLPLVVPPACGFRVGNEVREWEEGRLIIFDDTIEHEAWNDSDRDRVVLIFDIWRPELSARERREVAALFSEWAAQ
jgi:aspartyl/asparaginyl beta-hydroxylase (cupin superfamily)